MPASVHQPGIYRSSFGGSDRRFCIAIPDDHYKGAAPLVLALHWGGPLYPNIGGDLLVSLVEPALRELGAIIVAPDRTTEDWTNPQSEADLLELLDKIQSDYVIDPARTLITGYSIGGMGTWYMVAMHPDRFAAAIPIAASPPPKAALMEWAVPLYLIHGRQDELFPLQETEQVVQEMLAGGAELELRVVDQATHYQTDRYREPLRGAIPWIRRVWKRNQDKKGPSSRIQGETT